MPFMGLSKGIKTGISCAAILSVLSQRPVLAAPDVGDDAPLYTPPEEFTTYDKIPQPIPDAGFQIEDKSGPEKFVMYDKVPPIPDAGFQMQDQSDQKLANGFYIRYFVGNPSQILTKISELEKDGLLPNITTFDSFDRKHVELHLHYPSLDAAVEASINFIKEEPGRLLEIFRSYEGEMAVAQTFEPFVQPENPLSKKDRVTLAERLINNPIGVFKDLMSYWTERYKAGDLNKNLEIAIKRTRQASPTVRKFFQDYGVPIAFEHLGIVESHGNPFARSIMIKTEKRYKKVGKKRVTYEVTKKVPLAVGRFQFIAPTAKRMGCKIVPKLRYDERFNEYLSGECAAKLIKQLLMYFDNNPHISLLSYNSGMTGHHKKQSNGEPITVSSYFRFLGEKLENLPSDKIKAERIVENILQSAHFITRFMAVEHSIKTLYPEYHSLEPKQEYIIIKKGSTTLGNIAKMYGLPLDLVKSLNRHADPRYKLPADARIVLPYGSELKPKAEKPVYRAKKSDPVKAYNSQNTDSYSARKNSRPIKR